MKAVFIKYNHQNNCFDREIYEDIKDAPYTIRGYTEDLTERRNKGFACHRAELDNQPVFEGFLSPMWNGDGLRYETYEVYKMLSV